MAEKAWTPRYTQAEKDAIDKLVADSGLTRDFVVWYLASSNITAMDWYASFGDKAGKKLQSFRQLPIVDEGYNAWLAKRATQPAPPSAEAEAFGIGEPTAATDLFGYTLAQIQKLTGGEAGEVWKTQADEAAAAAGNQAEQNTAAEAVTGATAEVFVDLTPEQLNDLGAEGITEKFGLQQLAVQEPEAFLQAMFDKVGISPSPPIYNFLRNMMPGIVLLASTREGQDIIHSPGGAVELNKAINEVMTQGFPSRQSVLAGLQGMGGFARQLLEQGQEPGRSQFNTVMGTLDALLGPTMAQPIRRALFSDTAATQQGDRFLSAAARGVFQGDFIDWLRGQGYPIPELPAYKATPGATAAVAGAPFVNEQTGAVTSSSGAKVFPVAGATYE